MPNSPAIGFKPITADHYELLRAWLETPHMREWWGDPETELRTIREMVEGRDTTRPYLIVADERPVGYIQVWFIGHHQNADWLKENPWLAELPGNAVGVDLSIGDPDLLSQGIGSGALTAFVAMLRKECFETIIIDPDPSNARAIRAYEKAGFRAIPHLEGRTEGVHLMQHEPNASETPT
jgi:RimJ/RimL family protein N-acetyltransferase